MVLYPVSSVKYLIVDAFFFTGLSIAVGYVLRFIGCFDKNSRC